MNLKFILYQKPSKTQTVILIADSGSSKCEWCLATSTRRKTITTTGISPYFLSKDGMMQLLNKELLPGIKKEQPEKVFFYGTGLADKKNAALVKSVLQSVFPKAKINVASDLLGAARSLCGNNKGMVCILGTGSNSCYYNGNKIAKNSPGIGFILGDEGSGAYLGRKVIQYYLYKTFDEDIEMRFQEKYKLTKEDILDSVYKKPFPNRYLANFTHFLSENRGHYMIENILEDCINDFFFTHLNKYNQSWTTPTHFTGSVAYAFRDVIASLCNSYQLELGNIIKAPIKELANYHIKQ